MGWETIIPNSTINIRPTMMLTEDIRKPRYPRTKTHTNENRGSPSSHNVRTARRGRGAADCQRGILDTRIFFLISPSRGRGGCDVRETDGGVWWDPIEISFLFSSCAACVGVLCFCVGCLRVWCVGFGDRRFARSNWLYTFCPRIDSSIGCRRGIEPHIHARVFVFCLKLERHKTNSSKFLHLAS
jgi:hypothetical protein